jgi:dolichol-phosphate mannosyltransferase
MKFLEKLTFVIPSKNEEKNIISVQEEIYKYAPHSRIILVVDSDNDSTLNYINYKLNDIKVVISSKKGFGAAIIQGLNLVSTEFCCVCLSDGSSNVKDFIEMQKILINKDLDIIFGSRYEKNSKSYDDTLVTSFGNFIFSLAGKIFFKTKLNDILYTFVLMKTKMIGSLDLTRDDFTFCLELPLNVVKKKFKFDIFPTIEKKRISGKKKINILADGFKMIMYLIFRFLHLK